MIRQPNNATHGRFFHSGYVYAPVHSHNDTEFSHSGGGGQPYPIVVENIFHDWNAGDVSAPHGLYGTQVALERRAERTSFTRASAASLLHRKMATQRDFGPLRNKAITTFFLASRATIADENTIGLMGARS